MKGKAISIVCLFFLICFVLLAGSCKQTTTSGPDISSFQNPPVESSIHAWWHWLDNSITREGITKDLEAMKKQGISTATILNVSLLGERDLGVPQTKFNTEEWFKLFEWALMEADRIGMKIGAHNCDGWSSSGGPWISPEYSMKRCVWSRSNISGGGKVTYKLPQPKGYLGFYQDIRVVAFPVKVEENSFQKAKATIRADGSPTGDLMYDGDPFSMVNVKEGTRMDIVFNQDFTADKIAIHPRIEFVWGSLQNIHYQVELKSSADGRTFKSVQKFVDPVFNKTSVIDIKPTTARFYRLEFSNISDIDDAGIGISEAELLGKSENPAYFTRIPNHLEKTVTTMPSGMTALLNQGTDSSGAVPAKDILDLTQYMTNDGSLNWDAPDGKWEILRIGYTTTGAQNAPGTVAGTGLECDKMDTAALNLHFRSFPAKLIAHAGKYAGNTFEYLFIDSWECRYQNWTRNFQSEFEKRRHYSLINWLPVICGVTVNDNASTERFLHDFRQTIAELIEENYYRQFNELCHKYGVKSHAEVIYGGNGYPPLDILKSNSYVDVPMFEFWAAPDPVTGFIRYTPGGPAAYEIPVHAAALYGQQVVPAEAYTGFANYSESPWDLKLFGDRAFCTGINQMVLHSYVHQPFEKKPGVTLGVFGQSFNRHNPWWDFSSQWFTYHARVQYVLQQGVPVADILYFLGDRYYQEMSSADIYKIPAGYTVQKCNLDVLMNHCRIKDGKLHLDNGLSYAMLLLPDDSHMEAATLKRIAELVRAGAVVAGPKPLQVAGNLNYTENENELLTLSEKVWGKAGSPGVYENAYGRGKVCSGISLKEILENQEIKPDFSVQDEGNTDLLYIHKKIGDSDVYFVVNQENSSVDRECFFRITGKVPEIWDPQYGTVSLPAESDESDGLTHVKVKFRPKESLFFVFNNVKTPDVKIRQELTKNFVLQDLKGTLEFEDLPGKAPVHITGLNSWTNSDDPDIKYYSGKAKFSLDFDLPAELLNQKPVYISLDAVSAAIEIMLNNKALGCSAFPGYRFDVTGLLKEKANKLEVRVANTWRNRIIGDFTEFGELRNCWTTSPVDNLPGKDKPLLESGILGPVEFYY